MRQHKVTIVLIILLLLLLAAGFDYLYFKNRIYPGVYLKGISLGGKTLAGLEETLEAIEFELAGPQGKIKSFALREMGIIPRAEAIFESACVPGRKNTWPLTYGERLRLKREKIFIPFSYYLEEGLFAWSWRELEKTFNLDPANAFFKVRYTGGQAEADLIPEQNGYRIHKEKFLRELQINLNNKKVPFSLTIPGDFISPEVAVSLLTERGIKGLTSSCSTRFDPLNKDRVHNIKLAAATVHNHFLAPGEIFSLNKLIGDTTPEKGYKKAPVMRGNELVPGFGGGLCQISTTLYNAALLADLEILERHNHFMTIPYIAPGRDATIVYGNKDLKFRNNKDYFILISAEVQNDSLRFSFYGVPLEERISIATKFLKTYEPPLKYEYTAELLSGEEEVIGGSPGYLVETWKYIYRDGQQLQAERISLDSYAPHAALLRRGTDRP